MIRSGQPPAVPGAGVTPAIAGAGANTEVQSTNWSGYADISDTYQSVSSSWVEPTVNCSSAVRGGAKATYAAFWIGLDGYSSDSVEQTGTDSDCTAAGVPSYYGWYEMYPAGSVELSKSKYPVAPGNTLTSSVTSNPAGTSFTLTLSDTTANWTYSITKAAKGLARSSAEWVAEAPSSCSLSCSVLPLADFGTVGFSNASTADTAGNTGSISGFSDVEMQMGSGTKIKANPSSLGAGGASFSVTWVNR
ncbi:MAG: G1 family glutamic endopeptidase [Acidimicrobiales bacterium]